ncbi:MAG: rod shape-determining protein MreC [Candidatus Adlerbacteria bacterium]|nr:rod shape-determining protein MreC [Candidatus Adlerbacteria bacterium]
MAKTFNTGRGRRGGMGGASAALVWGVVLLCVFGAVVFWRASLAGFFWDALVPLQHFRSALGASDTTRLQAELASTTARVADRDALYKENIELKARLGRDAGVQTILGGVIMRPPGIPYDTLIIDAGIAEGVTQGQLVYAGGTSLIGTVGQVYAHTARVVLFSTAGETYDVLLKGSVPLTMQGQGGGSFVGQVPAGTSVTAGDTLVFPGVASGFAGVVVKVESRQAESFQTVYARLPVDPLTLRYVEVRK